jgi:DNA-binding transcriptional ArsR family regulator
MLTAWLLQLLGQGETAVEVLAAQAEITVANASQHLQRLPRAGLVNSQKEPHKMLYRLADDAIFSLLAGRCGRLPSAISQSPLTHLGLFSGARHLKPLLRRELRRRIQQKHVTYSRCGRWSSLWPATYPIRRYQ